MDHVVNLLDYLLKCSIVYLLSLLFGSIISVFCFLFCFLYLRYFCLYKQHFRGRGRIFHNILISMVLVSCILALSVPVNTLAKSSSAQWCDWPMLSDSGSQ